MARVKAYKLFILRSRSSDASSIEASEKRFSTNC